MLCHSIQTVTVRRSDVLYSIVNITVWFLCCRRQLVNEADTFLPVDACVRHHICILKVCDHYILQTAN